MMLLSAIRDKLEKRRQDKINARLMELICGECGSYKEHHCGMGACVDLCPKCDVLGHKRS